MYVTTFYSFKGGVGRTLALMNVAYELADSGLKVLVIDFDLEAPAIHADRWRSPKIAVSLKAVRASSDHPGLVEYVSEYIGTMRAPRVDDHIVDATPKGCKGQIALLPSGRVDDSYSNRLNRIDWHDLYDKHDGYVMFEDMRAQWGMLGFDYVLVDSRTGFTDVGGICTRHLPDAVVTMFRPDDQTLRGMEGVVESIRQEKPTPRRKGAVELHFVMAAIPDADDEEGILEERRKTFQKRLSIPSDQLLEIRHYQSMDLLTQPIYTDVRPRTALARSFQELAKRIRALNIGDREGVLGYLRRVRVRFPDRRDEDFLDRILQRYDGDAQVLGKLAVTYGVRGSFLDAANLLERIATLGPLAPEQWMRLAEARHLTRDSEGALRALHSFFQGLPDGSSRSERTRYDFVSRALSLLETLGADRVSRVDGSPIINGLSPSGRASVADHLDLSPPERRVAITILEDVLSSSEGSPIERAGWDWSLAFARMAVGDFIEAVSYFQSALTDSLPRRPVPTIFNLAMALWAETSVADSNAFAHVLDFYDAEDDKTWLDNNANALQSLAVAEWFGHRSTDAARHLDEAEQAIRGRRSDISCWSYTRVPPAEFLAHCAEIRRLFSGEDIKPAFMHLDGSG